MSDKTATQTMIETHDKEMRKRAFEHQLEAFLNHWKPHDHREASKFEAQLISLVRQVYHDAQEPILENFTKLAMSIPIPRGLL